MTAATCPVVGYLFPSFDQADDAFDPVALAAELAEMEAAPHTDEYDDAFLGDQAPLGGHPAAMAYGDGVAVGQMTGCELEGFEVCFVFPEGGGFGAHVGGELESHGSRSFAYVPSMAQLVAGPHR